MAETKITKNKVYLFLDISKTISSDAWKPTWKRIDRSTQFTLAMNANEQEMDYIAYEIPISEVDRYKPEIAQEIAMYRGNPIYDFIEEYFYDLPVGDAIKVPVLVVFPADSAGVYKAWQVKEARCIPTNFNPVDGKAEFNLKLGGDIQRGTATAVDGDPVFTEKTDA